MMSHRTAVLFLAWAAVAPGAHAQENVAIAALLGSPARYDQRDVEVTGVVTAVRYDTLPLFHNPNARDLVRLVAVADDEGRAAVWVVLPSAGDRRAPTVGVNVGDRVRMAGRFHATFRMIEFHGLAWRQ